MSGPPREPLEVRIGKGSPYHGPIPDAVDRVPGTISPPLWLAGEALFCWHHLVEILTLRGQLSRESYWSVLSFCECWAEWLELRQDIAENGRITNVLTTAGQRAKGKKKDPDMYGIPEMEPEESNACFAKKIRPEVTLFQDCDRRLRAWLSEFGLTDASRSKVSKGTPDLPTPKPKSKGAAPSPSDYGLSN